MRKAVSSKAPDCQVKKYVGTSFDDVKIVADNIDDVITVADNISKIDDVMPHVGDIAIVANNIDDVETVADNIADVNTLAPIASDITNVSTNIDAVKNTSDNMDAVIDAPNQAAAAKASADAALVSETNAKTSETNAKQSETNASTSEQNAAASAQAAQASASAASASEQAASTSETNAKQSETNAATSASAALASENAAKLSETNAKTSETNAAASALAASNSASAAATSETNAGISETNAKDSEIAAANSEQVATTKAAEASASAIAAKASEDAALQSKNDAELAKLAAQDAQEKSETIYEAFMKGAVYRGAWNPKTQVYPDPQGINSHWDVLLDSGVTYEDFDGKRWYSGDRLIWSEPDQEYFHVNRVAGVLSVNGKTGAVNITADDINAIDSVPATVPDVDALFAQNKHVIDHTNSSVPGLAGQRALLHIQNGQGGFQLTARSVGSEYHVRTANSSDGTIYPWERLYTTGYKPTPADIGAAPDDYSPSWAQVGLVKGTNLYRAVGRTLGSEASDWDTLDSAGIYARLINNTSINGPVGGTGYHYLENFNYGSTGNTTQLAIPYGISGKNGRIALRSRYNNVWNPWEYLYTTENKPTLTELGALGKTEAAVGISNPTNGTTSTDWDSFIPDDMKLTTTSINSPTGNAAHGFFLPHQGGFGTRFGTQFVARDNNYFLRSREDDAWNPWVEIYTSGNKPTAADINAVSKSGDTMTGDLVINTRLRTSTVVNNDNGEQGLLMYAGGTTRLGGSGASSMYFCPNGVSNNSAGDKAMELSKEGFVNFNADSATPLNIYRIGNGINVNMKFQGRNTDGTVIGTPWYAGAYTEGDGFGFGKDPNLAASVNRVLEIAETGVGVRATGGTSGMTIYSDDPAVIFYRNSIGKSGYIGMSGDTDDAFYVRPPSTGTRFKVYHQGNKPRADEVANNEVSLDGLSESLFYPLVFDANNTAGYVCHIDLGVGSGSGSDPYNNNTLVGYARGGGWSDHTDFWDVTVQKYVDSETNIHSMWEGAQNFSGIVIYVRGGQTVKLRSNSHARLYTSDFSLGGSVFKAGVSDPNTSGVVTNGIRLASFGESGRYCSSTASRFYTNEIKILPKEAHGLFKIETPANYDSMIRMSEDSAKHGAFLHYEGSGGNEFRIGTRNNDSDVIAMRIYRGSQSVHVGDELLAKDLNVSLNGGLKLSGRRAIRSTDSSWLRLNDEDAFSSGIYCGSSLLRTDGQITSGSWGGSTKSARVANNFTDSTWGTNGTAGFSVNNPDTASAHWLAASYYNSSNIRAGIQVLSTSEGRMRFYTNRRSKYVEINGGNVVAQGNVTGYSDARVKTDLEVIPNALDKVSQLTGYTYKRTDMDSDERKVGLIAQDVEKVLPEAVVTVDREDLGIDDFKTLDYGNMVALLVEGMKEQQAQIEELKKQIEELKK
ncbi:tail fibers protein [Vibrio phage BUCT194]|uniref:Tail fibers protein n=1 Tax=Vibrio phage BUCT194 TaxID=2859072 RepID=A0AAE8XFJ6_9CAUD|nr:tail fiber protein [Vibrio phage BUCT194]UAW01161.1 tail fibers protein [Vibrio phage BUCT194]